MADPARPAGDPEQYVVEVVVRLAAGTELSGSVRFSRGDPRGGPPLTAGDLAAKYRDCAGRVLTGDGLGRSLDLLGRLDGLPGVGPLTAALASGAAPGGTSD